LSTTNYRQPLKLKPRVGGSNLTGDIYPVTTVILRLNGVGVFNSGSISTAYFDHIVEREAYCGETIEIELIAMNLIGLEAIVTETIVTPTHLVH